MDTWIDASGACEHTCLSKDFISFFRIMKCAERDTRAYSCSRFSHVPTKQWKESTARTYGWTLLKETHTLSASFHLAWMKGAETQRSIGWQNVSQKRVRRWKREKKMDTIVRHKLFYWRAFEADNLAVQWREEETIKWWGGEIGEMKKKVLCVLGKKEKGSKGFHSSFIPQEKRWRRESRHA